MAKRLEEEEKVRIAEQKKALGPEGLKKVEAELEAAKKEHDKEIPVDILKSFPVPSVKSISWIPVQSLQEVGSGSSRRKTIEQSGNADLARHVGADGSELPFFVQYDHVEVRPLFALSICQRRLTRDSVRLRHNQRLPVSSHSAR